MPVHALSLLSLFPYLPHTFPPPPLLFVCFYKPLKAEKRGKTTRPFRYAKNQIFYDYAVEVTKRFMGLDQIECQKSYGQVPNIVQEAVIKSIPKKKKCKKAKWLPEEDLQTAEERREAKGKGEKEGCIHLSAEFQRIARREEKAFLTDQCKEIGENNRTGKTRDLFKKTRDIKGYQDIMISRYHAKMGTIKKRSC